jgi:hypothetical protein
MLMRLSICSTTGRSEQRETRIAQPARPMRSGQVAAAWVSLLDEESEELRTHCASESAPLVVRICANQKTESAVPENRKNGALRAREELTTRVLP